LTNGGGIRFYIFSKDDRETGGLKGRPGRKKDMGFLLVVSTTRKEGPWDKKTEERELHWSG